jgi:hypothetical protein
MENSTGEETGPKPSRRLLRLSVRALMLVVLTLALGLGWVVQRARVQREAVATIQKVGGNVVYDWQVLPNGAAMNPNGQPPGPKWLVERLGVDYFGDVIIVGLGIGKPVTEADMELIGRLGKLRRLYASRTEGLTDEGVARLRGLTHLEQLQLGRNKITGASLANFREMTQLKDLDLSGVPLADADLVHLEGLTSLTGLTLTSTSVTDAGLAHLEGLVNLKSLVLPLTGIRGEGLKHLGRMTQLSRLNLTGNQIADLSSLPPLPGLKVLYLDRAPLGDSQFASLSKFPALETLYLLGTNVTDAGLASLGELKNLKSLRLSQTKVTDAGMPTILNLKNLENLELAETKVTDTTLDRLGELKGLKTLDLEKATVTDAGIARLKAALPGLQMMGEMNAANARTRAANRARAASSRPPTSTGPKP